MRYLVDAQVLGELTRRTPSPRVIEWLRAHEADLVVDPFSLGELQHGILLRPRGKQRTALERWFAAGAGRLPVVSFDAETARAWAALLARLRRAGLTMPITDSLIAATAIAHGYSVVSRNRTEFEKAGVTVVDPYGEHGSP